MAKQGYKVDFSQANIPKKKKKKDTRICQSIQEYYQRRGY